MTARFSSNIPQKAWYQALNMAFLNSETNLKKAIKTYMCLCHVFIGSNNDIYSMTTTSPQ